MEKSGRRGKRNKGEHENEKMNRE